MDRFCYNSNNDWFDVLFCLNWSSWITWIVRLRLLRIQSLYCFDSILLHSAFTIYTLTLSHSGNDHDVTERAQGYTLQDEFFVRQSGVLFLTCEKTHKLHARWQAFSSVILADVTVVLEVRQSIIQDSSLISYVTSKQVTVNKTKMLT